MPIQIQGYRQRVATPSPGATPGLSVPRLPNIGNEISEIADDAARAYAAYERSENALAESEAIKQVAKSRMELETSYRSAQETAAPAAQGFTSGFMKSYDDKVTKDGEGLSSDKARLKYKEKMLGFGVSMQERSITWEAGQRQAQRTLNFETAADDHASTLFSTDAQNRELTFKLADEGLEQSLEAAGLPPKEKAELREKARAKLSYAAVQGDLRDRPDQVQDWLTKGGGSPYYSKVRGEVAAPDYYGSLKTTESGGRNIQSESSSAFGPYQFTKGTWKSVLDAHPELGLTEADRYKPAAQEIAIRAFTDDNSVLLKAAGYAPTNVNLYMMHFLGSSGGTRFINAVVNNRDDEARNHVSPEQVAANPTIFRPGRTVKDVYLTFGQKFGAQQDVKPSAEAGTVGGAPVYYADLTFDHRSRLYDQADAELRKRRAEGAAAFKQSTDNVVAEYASKGFSTTTVDEAQFTAAYGISRGSIEFGEFQAATLAAAASHDLRVLDVRQHAEYIQGLEPQEGDPFYAEKFRAFQTAKAESLQIKTAINTDSAAYVLAINPQLSENLRAIADVEKVTAQDRQAAVKEYTTNLAMEYDRLGVDPKMRRTVPKTYAESLAANLEGKLRSDADATQTVAMLQHYASAWGSEWQNVYADLSDKMSAPLKVVTSGINPRAASVLVSVADKSFDDLTKVFDKSTRIDVITNLQDEFKPFQESTGFQASALPNVNTFFEQGKKLAAVYVAQGESASGAAEKAYNDLIGYRYRMVSESTMNVRIPRKYDNEDMEAVLRFSRYNVINSDNLQVGADIPGVGLDEATRLSRTRNWLDRNAKWVTMPNDAGVALFVNGYVWADKTGRPLTKTWQELEVDHENLKINEEYNSGKGPFGWSFE